MRFLWGAAKAATKAAARVASWLTWQRITRTLGLTIVLVELREVHGRRPVDQGLLLLAAALMGLASAFRRNGNGSA